MIFSSEISLNLLDLTWYRSDLDSLYLPTVVHFPFSTGITAGGCCSLTYYGAFSLICCRFLLKWYQGAAGCLLGSIEKTIFMQMQFTKHKLLNYGLILPDFIPYKFHNRDKFLANSLSRQKSFNMASEFVVYLVRTGKPIVCYCFSCQT